MTPSQGPADPSEPVHPESPLTAEEESEVAALLADAVGTEPVAPPPAVVARLDDVLVRLVEDRAAAARAAEDESPRRVPGPAGSGATVVPLGTRRRRLPRVLLAAAAVVLGGYAVGNVVSDGSLSGSGDGDAASSGAGGATSDGGGSTDSEQLERGLAREEAMTLAPVVRGDDLAADVRRVVRLLGPRSVVTRPDDATPGGRDGSVDETPDCPVPRLTDRQRHYVVRYQGDLAGLVLGPERGGRVDATVYSCADGGVELSRTIPAP